MKKITLFIALAALSVAAQAQVYSSDIKDCRITKYDGNAGSTTYPLYGNIRVVTDPKEKADFNVMIVKEVADADVWVKVVKYRSYECGEWRWVNKDEIFSIRFVKDPDKADFKIIFGKDIGGSRY